MLLVYRALYSVPGDAGRQFETDGLREQKATGGINTGSRKAGPERLAARAVSHQRARGGTANSGVAGYIARPVPLDTLLFWFGLDM